MAQPLRVDLRSLMARAEAAAPVGTVDAMAAGLLEMLGAQQVSFLIADLSGRTLSRLGHTVANGSPVEETIERVNLKGHHKGNRSPGSKSSCFKRAPPLACWRP